VTKNDEKIFMKIGTNVQLAGFFLPFTPGCLQKTICELIIQNVRNSMRDISTPSLDLGGFEPGVRILYYLIPYP
jgi:hypothetical protein